MNILDLSQLAIQFFAFVGPISHKGIQIYSRFFNRLVLILIDRSQWMLTTAFYF
jgi:hypothetical protein